MDNNSGIPITSSRVSGSFVEQSITIEGYSMQKKLWPNGLYWKIKFFPVGSLFAFILFLFLQLHANKVIIKFNFFQYVVNSYLDCVFFHIIFGTWLRNKYCSIVKEIRSIPRLNVISFGLSLRWTEVFPFAFCGIKKTTNREDVLTKVILKTFTKKKSQ